ncbi:hypothetical protein [Cellulomonas bogoriensis]|nr:hypothetical protein [Cellulomonas bogoriensis]
MDLEVIEHLGRRHTMAAEDLEEALTSMPTSVDGGVASAIIATIISHLATGAGDLATTSRLMGAALADSVADSRRTDASIASTFGAALAPLEDQR